MTFEVDDHYVESVAYHEAGHIVVAAAQGLGLRRSGLCVDETGFGFSSYALKKPDGSEDLGPEPSREKTIIATYAGLPAQRRFLPNCPIAGFHSDQSYAWTLLREMYSNGSLRSDADSKLYERSEQLVDRHWVAIESLAKALWAKPFVPQTLVEKRWSRQWREKRLTGEEVINLLSRHQIPAEMAESDIPR